jgi:hypothetical protein
MRSSRSHRPGSVRGLSLRSRTGSDVDCLGLVQVPPGLASCQTERVDRWTASALAAPSAAGTSVAVAAGAAGSCCRPAASTAPWPPAVMMADVQAGVHPGHQLASSADTTAGCTPASAGAGWRPTRRAGAGPDTGSLALITDSGPRFGGPKVRCRSGVLAGRVRLLCGRPLTVIRGVTVHLAPQAVGWRLPPVSWVPADAGRAADSAALG